MHTSSVESWCGGLKNLKTKMEWKCGRLHARPPPCSCNRRSLPPSLVAAAPQANTGCEPAHVLGVFTASNYTRVSLAPTVTALGPAVTDGERSGRLRRVDRHVTTPCRRRVSRCVTRACGRTCLAPAATQSNAKLLVECSLLSTCRDVWRQRRPRGQAGSAHRPAVQPRLQGSLQCMMNEHGCAGLAADACAGHGQTT